jgi:hypothetical protein
MRPFDHGQKPRRLFGESDAARVEALTMLDRLGITPDCGLHKLTVDELRRLVGRVLRAIDNAAADVH